MPTALNLTFSAAPLPDGFTGTPQEFLDTIVARLAAQNPSSIGFFVTGDVAPTSNVGPWLKNGTTWFVWSDSLGQYVPEILDDESVRYVASQLAPDPAIFTFWIKLDNTGKAQSIQFYSGGAWKDVYEDKFATYSTTTEMNAAIAAAIAGATFNAVPFRASQQAATQTITAGSGDTTVSYDAEDFDPSNVFSANKFTAPVDGYYWFKGSVFLSLDSGSPTTIDRQIKLLINGSLQARGSEQVNDLTGSVVLEVSDTVFMAAGQQASIAIYVTSTGASTWATDNNSATTFFTGYRVQSP